MLRSMRADFKKYSWTLWLVIIAFLLGFSFTDIFTRRDVSDTVIARVGKKEIKVERYQKQLFQVIDNYKNQMKGGFNKEMITQMRVPEQILQNLINSEIIRNESDKLNLRATKSELTKMIMNFPAFQKEGKFVGISEYKRYLAIFRTNAKDFESDLKKDIVNNKLKEIVTASMIIDNSTLKDIYRKENDSADVDYIKLKINTSKSDFTVSDQELKNYFEKNKENFMTPEKRKGNIIALKYADFMKDLKLTEKDFYDYFRKNKEQFQIPEKIRVYRLFIEYSEKNREDVLKKIQSLKEDLNVDNFESFVHLHSTGAKKVNGGDWGYSEWRSLTSQEQSIIKSLKQSEISDPVDTFSGFSILYTKEKTNEMQEPYETAKIKIKNIMEKEALRNIVTLKLKKIYEKVKNSPDLSSAKNDKTVKVVDTGYLINGDAIKGVEQFGYLSRKLFDMNKNEIAYPAEFMDGIAIVQLVSIKEPENETFENVKGKVKELVITDKQINDVIKKSETLSYSLNKLSDKDSIEKFIKKQDMELKNLSYKRGNKIAGLGQDEKLDNRVFNNTDGKFSKPFRIGDNVVILRSTDIKVSSDTDFENEKDTFYNKKLKEMKDNYFISYILSKRLKYRVGINQDLYEKIKESVISRFN